MSIVSVTRIVSICLMKYENPPGKNSLSNKNRSQLINGT